MGERKVPVEVYSRVVGYFRPTFTWNKGKCEEFRQRKPYVFNDKVKEKIHGTDNSTTVYR